MCSSITLVCSSSYQSSVVSKEPTWILKCSTSSCSKKCLSLEVDLYCSHLSTPLLTWPICLHPSSPVHTYRVKKWNLSVIGVNELFQSLTLCGVSSTKTKEKPQQNRSQSCSCLHCNSSFCPQSSTHLSHLHLLTWTTPLCLLSSVLTCTYLYTCTSCSVHTCICHQDTPSVLTRTHCLLLSPHLSQSVLCPVLYIGDILFYLKRSWSVYFC